MDGSSGTHSTAFPVGDKEEQHPTQAQDTSPPPNQQEIVNTVATRASVLLDTITAGDLENVIQDLKSLILDIVNNEQYNPEESNMESIYEDLFQIEEFIVEAKAKLALLINMEDSSVNRETISYLETSYSSNLSTFMTMGNQVVWTVAQLNFALGLPVEDDVTEDDLPVRELSLQDTTLKKTEYTQNDKSQGKEICIFCRDNFVVGDCLQRCPRCQKSFHEHCIKGNLRVSHKCPLCRYNLEKCGTDDTDNTADNDMGGTNINAIMPIVMPILSSVLMSCISGLSVLFSR